MKTKLVSFRALLASAVIFSALSGCSKAAGNDENDLSEASANKLLETSALSKGAEVITHCVYTCVHSMPVEPLSTNETALLNFVREEELLAFDVYTAMYSQYKLPVFNNISKSETLHTTAIKALIEKYGLADVATGHRKGVFENADIQKLYDKLVAKGSASLNDALTVGAIIEEFDIADLVSHLDTDADNTDIRFVLNQLCKGSRNHLRAFSRLLTLRRVVYEPQYISAYLYKSITGSKWETGGGFCQCTNEKIIDLSEAGVEPQNKGRV